VSEPPIRVGVSSCLLGETVRYDGGHKRDAFVSEVLGRFVEWVPVCPELESGLGVPRPPMRLVRSGDEVRLVEIKSGVDHTRAVARWASARLRSLRALALCGYVLKKDSPSCGMERVKVYGRAGMPERNGAGIYARALREAFPNLPVEGEGRLRDPELRENFIERVFALARWRALVAARPRARDLVAFHAAQKYAVLAHSPAHYTRLGRLVATAGRALCLEDYGRVLMEALAVRATRGRHANVLGHLAGYFKRDVPAGDRAELAEVIDEYRRGLVPLIVPITLVRHHARRLGLQELAGQVYLNPHPKELMLRNHV